MECNLVKSVCNGWKQSHSIVRYYKQVLSSLVEVMTSFAVTPIIPYPAAEFDAIFTCMKYFQDALQQQDLE